MWHSFCIDRADKHQCTINCVSGISVHEAQHGAPACLTGTIWLCGKGRWQVEEEELSFPPLSSRSKKIKFYLARCFCTIVFMLLCLHGLFIADQNYCSVPEWEPNAKMSGWSKLLEGGAVSIWQPLGGRRSKQGEEVKGRWPSEWNVVQCEKSANHQRNFSVWRSGLHSQQIIIDSNKQNTATDFSEQVLSAQQV